MYAALWRALPGNRWAKGAEALVLFLAVVAVLFLWVFPRLTPFLPFENVTVQPATTVQPSTTAPSTPTSTAGTTPTSTAGTTPTSTPPTGATP